MNERADAMRVGFVGLGNMGWPMAHNLVTSRFEVVARDADEDLQRRFVSEHGCVGATDPADFATIDAVVAMLPDDRAVRSAVVDWGIAATVAPGTVVVEMSSSRPMGTIALAQDLRPRGIVVIDAPVSGGIQRAETATLSIMVGGDDEEAIERVRPIFDALGQRTFRTGGLGSGHAMKALNNFVAATAYTASVEALAVGRAFGLDPETMIDVVNASTGRSFSSEQVVKEHVVSGRYATGFALGLLAKDVAIAADLADATGVDAPTCRLVSARWAEAFEEFGLSADHSEAHKRWWPTRFDTPAEPKAERVLGASPPSGD